MCYSPFPVVINTFPVIVMYQVPVFSPSEHPNHHGGDASPYHGKIFLAHWHLLSWEQVNLQDEYYFTLVKINTCTSLSLMRLNLASDWCQTMEDQDPRKKRLIVSISVMIVISIVVLSIVLFLLGNTETFNGGSPG
ncbi:hypothetical protein GF325_05435 [Candidatus Bathyarchaeota archaeon]|nr:hypothetical protein [Candidatus Bathyarchaeota archaeon]